MFVSSYARFSSAPFTLDVLDDRSAPMLCTKHCVCMRERGNAIYFIFFRFIHLCNRSVQEKVGTVGSGSPEEVEVGEESGLMWSSQQLQQQLMWARSH